MRSEYLNQNLALVRKLVRSVVKNHYICNINNVNFCDILRLERLDHLAKKFKHKCDIHEEWAYGKEDMLQAQDFKQCRLNDLKVCCVLSSFILSMPYRI